MNSTGTLFRFVGYNICHTYLLAVQIPGIASTRNPQGNCKAVFPTEHHAFKSKFDRVHVCKNYTISSWNRIEQDELTSTRRLLVAEEEQSKLQELAQREGNCVAIVSSSHTHLAMNEYWLLRSTCATETLRMEEEAARLEASRQHELKSLELAWRGTVALAVSAASIAFLSDF